MSIAKFSVERTNEGGSFGCKTMWLWFMVISGFGEMSLCVCWRVYGGAPLVMG
jgi:hypothetical protein